MSANSWFYLFVAFVVEFFFCSATLCETEKRNVRCYFAFPLHCTQTTNSLDVCALSFSLPLIHSLCFVLLSFSFRLLLFFHSHLNVLRANNGHVCCFALQKLFFCDFLFPLHRSPSNLSKWKIVNSNCNVVFKSIEKIAQTLHYEWSGRVMKRQPAGIHFACMSNRK